MKKIVRLTESDLVKIVKRVLNEQVPLSNVRDNTNVVLPRITSPSENVKYYKESIELTRQGCTQTDYELDDFDIEKGDCFVKNDKPLEFLLDKKLQKMNQSLRDSVHVSNKDNKDNILQSIPDAVLLDSYGDKGDLYYFCDKNPIDKKSNFIYINRTLVKVTSKRFNNSHQDFYLLSTIPLKKSVGNSNETTITLDTPLRKFFCSGR